MNQTLTIQFSPANRLQEIIKETRPNGDIVIALRFASGDVVTLPANSIEGWFTLPDNSNLEISAPKLPEVFGGVRKPCDFEER